MKAMQFDRKSCEVVEICLEKLVKSHQVLLFLVGFGPFGTCVVAEAVAVEAALTSWPLNGLSSQRLLGGDSISNGLRL